MAKKFAIPFAQAGDKAAVPDALQPDGSVSYTAGFGPDYELDKDLDPVNAKDVPRDQTNQLFNDLTGAVGEVQLLGYAEWSADLSPYPLNARAALNSKVWRSAVAVNNGTPGVDPEWEDVSENAENLLDSIRINVASASSVDLVALAPDTRYIQITGDVTINDFVIENGQKYFVRFSGSPLLTNSASLVAQYGENIQVEPGDTCVIAATADNVVEVLFFTKDVADLPFTAVFETSPLTWTSAGAVGPFAHSLGGAPKFITYEYNCVANDNGYVAGDKAFFCQPTTSSASDGLTMVGDATNISGRWGSLRIGSLLNKTTGVVTALTAASWNVIVRAYI